jgi:hypothetical protein
MRPLALLPIALLVAGCIVEAPSGDKASPVERARNTARDAPPLTVKIGANLEGKVEIMGATVAPGQLAPGEQAKVTLYMKVLEELGQDYMIFIHVEDIAGRVERMNVDHAPVEGKLPTSQWKKGDTIRDEFLLYVPPGLPVRGVNVWGGFWEPRTDTRLKLSNPDQVKSDGSNRILFAQVPVLQ